MARSPLMHGDTIIGEVIADEEVAVTPEDQVLIVRLTHRSALVKELMREELVYFDIQNIPAVRF
ncbi:hypothetical protein SEA_CATERPILLAR_59 [Arthrobacter phage Caterpillar]|nr:hypothetical protein SEA_CATERPILLAR_59 [Arthrobacter phage Caterpillar]